MKPRREVTPALSRLIDDQEGVLTRAQALTGLGHRPLERLLRTSAWTVLTPGAYAATPNPTVRHRLWAGHLLGGAESALGDEAALYLAGLRPEPATVTTWVPLRVQRSSRKGWVFPRDGWGRLAHARGTLPVIHPAEALIDLGQHLDVEGWVELLSDAARERHVALADVEGRLRARPRVSQRAMLLAVLADARGVESTLEWVYLRDVEQRHALPAGRRQVVVVAGSRCDVVYDDYGVVVEVDGRVHVGRAFRDLDRDNTHALRGATTLRYGSRDLRGRPCAAAWQVGGALGRGGWPGLPRRCRECPPEPEARRLAGLP